MMHCKKVAVFLIWIQGFILAHSFLPHYHRLDEDFAHTTDHFHDCQHGHQHDHDGNVIGADEDEGVLDFLFLHCNHSKDAKLYVSQQKSPVVKVDKHKVKQQALPLDVFQLISNDDADTDAAVNTLNSYYSNKHKFYFSLRGPPFFIV